MYYFMKTVLFVLLIAFTAVSCVPGPNSYVLEKTESTKPAGFWKGLWHGLITPVTFFISLFNKNVNVYEVRNNRNWYNWGYVIGLSIIFGSAGGGAGRNMRRKK